MSASSSELAGRPSPESGAGGFLYSGSLILIDEAGTGAFEIRNEVDDEVLRLTCRILVRFVGVMSFVKTRDAKNSSLDCLFADGGE